MLMDSCLCAHVCIYIRIEETEQGDVSAQVCTSMCVCMYLCMNVFLKL